ncbi:MAG: hypothetical protein CML20_06080 [Rheinheimera sp.]|uniref:hypothetical protein n=1 Tax=Arsukibacterium sp. UBA3155 TaxID=1946058 RepID=UPI000C966AD9|nr:hypothetical protein [Arsukibacterium sp. UBA3155]MAD74352.1 hypothetical protein [Rheinheimera sp.]|tara:strand:+ start:51258 stop:52097 length:840 start_codon:yes stop_codon:yes gene_type:complete
MKFAKFWVDVSVKVDKSIFGTNELSVWGASNESLDLAIAHATNRAEQLKMFANRGLDALRDYEYCNGYIREEVLEEIKCSAGNTIAVMTRNNYGSLVINAESVFFGDIDIPEVRFFDKIAQFFGKPEKNKTFYLDKIQKFQQRNSDYAFRVYETSAGLRLVVTNKVFDHKSAEAERLFNGLDIDPLYVRLCHAQSCFRARLTPKPWRIGLCRPVSSYPRTDNKSLAEFSNWLKAYGSAAKAFRAVNLLASFGDQSMHEHVSRVLDIHDKLACSGGESLA